MRLELVLSLTTSPVMPLNLFTEFALAALEAAGDAASKSSRLGLIEPRPNGCVEIGAVSWLMLLIPLLLLLLLLLALLLLLLLL